ncbi:SDR family NAD(P)-dependent oxidoreductase [Amycolatopsis thermoflava]|uniref:SDR family NAD(P)-dependent oxidoreductase n=1 Tax=Amycolatopsis thermoflava TaxID=84480 RepID=UPI003653423E
MESDPVAVVAGESGPLVAAVVRALADTHEVWVAGAGGRSAAGLAAACPPAKPWPDEGPGPARIGVLVHCIDEYAAGPLAETPVDTWRELFEANVFDVARFTARALPALRDAGGLVIVVNSPGVADSPGERGAYAASKAALSVVTDMLREEEGPRGVRVSALDLGWDDAAGSAGGPDALAAAVRLLVALPRQACPVRLAMRTRR